MWVVVGEAESNGSARTSKPYHPGSLLPYILPGPSATVSASASSCLHIWVGLCDWNWSPQRLCVFKLHTLHSVHMVFSELGENCVHRSQNLMRPASIFSPWCSFPRSFPSLFYFLVCTWGFLNTLLRKYPHKLISLPLMTSE